MVNLSNSECVNMVMLYGVAHENTTRNCASSAFQIARFRVPEHSTFKPQTYDRGRDRTERVLQAEEQILERVEEEPDIRTCRLVLKLKLEFHSLYYIVY
ncbi:hypothetical protein Zmor_005599 [Zophobas morio]|uniref:Uncharacterized protein n=1 Tax=Zophobas morio TaxID=2755281 RepID=A0AA38MLX5_9CUCU|nr:hypothetical protein Zmor_005599 [Zophobas morio]